jgi:hypothetical protein
MMTQKRIEVIWLMTDRVSTWQAVKVVVQIPTLECFAEVRPREITKQLQSTWWTHGRPVRHVIKLDETVHVSTSSLDDNEVVYLTS